MELAEGKNGGGRSPLRKGRETGRVMMRQGEGEGEAGTPLWKGRYWSGDDTVGG
jgi:hypothetical protein